MNNEDDDFREIATKADYDQEFLKFVQEKIKELSDKDNLGHQKIVSFDALYGALQSYQQTYWSLLALYEKAEIERKQKDAQFKLWWDERFILIRQRENKLDMAAQKWASKAELESMTRIENRDEYLKWEEEMRKVEGVSSFLRRLMDQWLAQNHILGHLTSLIKTDVGTTNIGSRLN